MSSAQWVSEANRRLKGCGVTLELRGLTLYIRGQFPGKPWTNDTEKRQRRISLKLKALTKNDVKEAEIIARQVSVDLNRDEFDWGKFSEVEIPIDDSALVKRYVEELIEERKPRVSPYRWRTYERHIKKLNLNAVLSEEYLMSWILEHDPHCGTSRKDYLTIARILLRLANIPDNKLERLSTQPKERAINPRTLPSDADIEACHRHLLSLDPQWAYVYAVLATYGLRPHEYFHLDFSAYPDLKVLEPTKTGERFILPLYDRWVDLFGIKPEIVIPARLREFDRDNAAMGKKINANIRRFKLSTGIPYNLRHCYARRCLELGISSDLGAPMMGHSKMIHEKTYRAFIHKSLYVDLARKIVEKNQKD